MSELPANHDEALALANMKFCESNLARCYLERDAELAALRQRVAELEAQLAQSCQDDRSNPEMFSGGCPAARDLRARVADLTVEADEAVALLHDARLRIAELEAALREAADPRFERAAHHLMQVMQAYERRVRTDCTPAEIEKRPWECAEYVAAADFLRKVWPVSRQQEGGK